MASSPAVADAASLPAPAGKTSLVTLIIAIVAAVVLSIAAIGGTMVYLIRSGRLPVQKTITVEAKAEPTAASPSHTMALESVVANLTDSAGPAYLKMGLMLKIADEPVKKGAPKEEKAVKGMSDDEAGVRDTVLMVVGHQTADSLLAADGKERLKTEIKAALKEHNPELKVIDVHFTDFLVQR